MSTRFECQVTASILDASRTLADAGNVMALAAAIGYLTTDLPFSSQFFVATLAPWIVVCWLASRMRIDAALFRVLASADPGVDDLDALLRSWRLLNRARNRSIAKRSRSSIRMLRCLSAAVVLEFGTLLAGMALQKLY